MDEEIENMEKRKGSNSDKNYRTKASFWIYVLFGNLCHVLSNPLLA
jgi:hypothetical protein